MLVNLIEISVHLMAGIHFNSEHLRVFHVIIVAAAASTNEMY